VDVDPRSLRHRRFDHVFALGDVCGAPNAKTGAAIRKQAPVVVANLLALMASRAMTGSYDGYASCPLVTGFGKVVLAEFGYDGKLMPSFPGNPARESRMMWWLKTRLLPVLYWRFMLRGRA
jgi:sulfide:quinone oxidoreductase